MQTNFIIKNKNPRIKSLGDNITSHHQMACTPSGTDLQTLREEGNERNCFVSLIVNNAGKYYAAVTRKVQTKSEVTVKNLGTSYEFFGDGSKEITKENTETTKVIDKEVIEYFDLEVERHEVHNSLSYLDTRFDEIEKKKASRQPSRSKSWLEGRKDIGDKGFLDWLHNDKKELEEGNLFSKEVTDSSKDFTAEDEEKLRDIIAWEPDAKKVHRAVCRMLTCNLIINPDKFDLKQWIHKHMMNVYGRIFSLDNNEYSNVDSFSEWKDFITQFTMDYFDMSDAPDELVDDWDTLSSIVAKAIYDELGKYAKENAFIQEYQEAIEQYIME